MEYVWAVLFYDYTENKPKFVLPSAAYPDHWVLFALEEGSFRYTISGFEGTVQAGDILLCPPGTTLGREMLTPAHIHYIGLVPSINLSDSASALLSKLQNGTADSYRIPIADRTRFHSTLGLLKQTAFQGAPYEAERIHYVNDLWMLIVNEWNRRGRSSSAPPLMECAKQWVEAEAYGPLQLTDIAARIGLSRVAFTRKFHAAFGIAPKEYVTLLKMERAKSLLTSTEYTVDHIGKLCGYESGFYFSRVFNDQLGMRPSEYRKLFTL